MMMMMEHCTLQKRHHHHHHKPSLLCDLWSQDPWKLIFQQRWGAQGWEKAAHCSWLPHRLSRWLKVCLWRRRRNVAKLLFKMEFKQVLWWTVNKWIFKFPNYSPGSFSSTIEVNMDRNTDRILYDGTEMTLRSFSHSKADLLVCFGTRMGAKKGSKVVQYAVCWCILPLWNVWGSFLASRFINWGIKQFHPVECSVLANLRWQLWMLVVADIWVCPTLPGP